VTNNAFLIKIIPPEGYNVYRLHFSRTLAIAIAVGFLALLGAALGFHAWQLHLAEEDVQALQALTAAQHAKLQAIDRQALLVHEAMLDEVVDARAGIVIGDGETAQADRLGLLHHRFRLRHAIRREARMAVKIDLELHVERTRIYGRGGWK